MSTIGPAKSIARIVLQLFSDIREIPFRYDTIRIQNQQILAIAAFCSIIPTWSRTGILFEEIVDIK